MKNGVQYIERKDGSVVLRSEAQLHRCPVYAGLHNPADCAAYVARREVK